MDIDRVWRPESLVAYKPTTKKGYTGICIFCIFIGFSASFFQLFEFNVVLNETVGYKKCIHLWDDENNASHIRNAIWILGLILLYFCNSAIPFLYKKRLEQSKMSLAIEAKNC